MFPYLVLMGVIGAFFAGAIVYIVIVSFIEARGAIKVDHISIHRSDDEITQVTHG